MQSWPRRRNVNFSLGKKTETLRRCCVSVVLLLLLLLLYMLQCQQLKLQSKQRGKAGQTNGRHLSAARKRIWKKGKGDEGSGISCAWCVPISSCYSRIRQTPESPSLFPSPIQLVPTLAIKNRWPAKWRVSLCWLQVNLISRCPTMWSLPLHECIHVLKLT